MNNSNSGPERNNFKNSEHQQQANTVNTVFLKKEQETAETGVCSGLSLLVAAVDAQDSELSSKFERPNSGLSMDGYSSTSHSPHSAENSAGQGETKNGRRRSIPDSEKDDCYWEKRRRNNEAAKKSREKRRLNDMAMESRLLELSKENNLLRSELNCVAKQPVKPEPQTPSIHHNTTPTPLQPPTGCVPFTRVPSQAAPAETMLPNPPIPTNPLTGLPAPNPPTAPPHPALAAALNANPAAALPQSLLTAMLPPSALLQQLSAAYSQAHAAALLATQQPHMLPPQPKPPVCAASQSLPLLTGTFNGAPPAKQASPDSTVEKVLKSDPANQNSSMDGKQYLRYKLLERQNKRLNPPPTLGTPGTSPLGSLLAQRADSSFRESVITRQNSLPAVRNQEPSGGQLTVKQCLSSLAVHLGSDRSATGSGRSDSSVTGSEGSQVSPASSHGSSVSQPSPPHAILDALGISNGNHECSNAKINGNCQNLSESERYIERRRRNNEAAKRCRANRRALFEYRFKRAQELEQENVQLKEEMQRLSRELMELKELLARKNGRNGLLPTFPTLPTSAEENDGFSTAQEVTVGVQNGGVGNFLQNDGHDVHTPTSGDFSSESGNDENYVGSSESGNLVIAEDLS